MSQSHSPTLGTLAASSISPLFVDRLGRSYVFHLEFDNEVISDDFMNEDPGVGGGVLNFK